ncbi:cation transport ATPase [Paenibacillus anaericanus]|uniref:hypothetical protein n=1 Tax=Paenibacillus anaericanus TaxID=170367 RepID=UPI002784C1B6|nr:hypothetical protein [Paenibacillus anaericanus]MDQ0086726.1 cation transport ATPase [Paenibacillus anaericanus]
MEIDIKKIEKLISKRSSKAVFMEAFIEILPKRENWISFLIFSVIAIIPALIIGVSINTVELFYKAIANLNPIILALFAIVFTGYALFQALINDDLLKRLIIADGATQNKKSKSKDGTSKDESGKSKLQENNEYFVKFMMLIVFAIIINAILLLLVGSLPEDFHLPIKNIFNNMLAAISIWAYFVFMILILWEMKSFVFNMFQLFNAHAGSKAIYLLRNEERED